MTEQEVFDKVYKHLLTQRIQATEEGGLACWYRTPEGLSCAVGCLFTEKEYRPEMEGESVDGLRLEGLLPKRLTDHISLLKELQAIHDDHEPVTWKCSLNQLAARLNLRIPACTS